MTPFKLILSLTVAGLFTGAVPAAHATPLPSGFDYFYSYAAGSDQSSALNQSVVEIQATGSGDQIIAYNIFDSDSLYLLLGFGFLAGANSVITSQNITGVYADGFTGTFTAVGLVPGQPGYGGWVGAEFDGTGGHNSGGLNDETSYFWGFGGGQWNTTTTGSWNLFETTSISVPATPLPEPPPTVPDASGTFQLFAVALAALGLYRCFSRTRC